MTTDAVVDIARYAADLQFEHLPDEVVDATKRCIVDTLAVAAAGSVAPSATALLRVARAWGGAPACTVIGHPDRLPPYLATMVNAGMVHQHDFDDTHDAAVCHPTSASLTAALAVGEARGGIDGRTLIAAVALGNDVASRLGLAIRGTLWDYAWVRAPVVGIFGAVVAAGHVLGFDAEGMHNALGLALPQAAGTLESVSGTRSAVRMIRDGLIYKDAVLAASLAAQGVPGDDRVFDGPHGLFASYFRGEYDRSALVDDLGERFEGVNVSLKPWPSCRHTHGTITALLEAVDGLEVADLAEVVIGVGAGNRHLVDKPWPGTRSEALCNLPFVAAAVLVHHDLPLDAFEPERLDAPGLHAAAALIRWQDDPAQEEHGTIEPGHVLAGLRDGTQREVRVAHGLGHPTNPMSEAQLSRKAAACLTYAGLGGTAEAAELLDRGMGLDVLGDCGTLLAPVTRSA
jgi:2-methylcitrate dehydratase PrpD